MIYKSYLVEQNIDLLNNNIVLFYGENLGLKNDLKIAKLIMFEHHYHNMLIKNYKFRDIHQLLKKNNFKQIYKYKMAFRKTFEYIYEYQK